MLEATRQRSRELGLTYHETECWDDLDELDDLRRLVARSPEVADGAAYRYRVGQTALMHSGESVLHG